VAAQLKTWVAHFMAPVQATPCMRERSSCANAPLPRSGEGLLEGRSPSCFTNAPWRMNLRRAQYNKSRTNPLITGHLLLQLPSMPPPPNPMVPAVVIGLGGERPGDGSRAGTPRGAGHRITNGSGDPPEHTRFRREGRPAGYQRPGCVDRVPGGS
jgi:hypothetical protein